MKARVAPAHVEDAERQHVGIGEVARPAMQASTCGSRSNCSSSAGQLSQKSSLIRHMLACRMTCSAASRGVSPGERLSTIGRPVLSIALRIASISALCW